MIRREGSLAPASAGFNFFMSYVKHFTKLLACNKCSINATVIMKYVQNLTTKTPWKINILENPFSKCLTVLL
jgi:hypothetical protein